MMLLFLSVFPIQDAVAASEKHVALTGVNLAGGEFAGDKIPGVYARDYIYPSATDIALFAALGMNTVRVPFLWERMQPVLNEALDAQEVARYDATIAAARAHHMTILIDLHNFGSYRGGLVGSAAVPASAFEDFWRRFATHYRDEPLVAFGLMNEPNRQSAEEWATIAEGAISTIRKTGAKQLILVPGTIYTGAHSWNAKVGDLSNAEALTHIKDPANNIAIELHQYFDSDSSGTQPSCVDADVGARALSQVTPWLRATGHKGFLAEFGASQEPVCLAALRNTLAHMQQNADVWQGWTYWAASPWFGDYIFNIYPPEPSRYKQVSVLKEFLHDR